MFLVFPSHGDLGRRVVGNGENRTVFAVPGAGKAEVLGHVGVQLTGIGFGRDGGGCFGIDVATVGGAENGGVGVGAGGAGVSGSSEDIVGAHLGLDVVDGGVVGA